MPEDYEQEIAESPIQFDPDEIDKYPSLRGDTYGQDGQALLQMMYQGKTGFDRNKPIDEQRDAMVFVVAVDDQEQGFVRVQDDAMFGKGSGKRFTSLLEGLGYPRELIQGHTISEMFEYVGGPGTKVVVEVTARAGRDGRVFNGIKSLMRLEPLELEEDEG